MLILACKPQFSGSVKKGMSKRGGDCLKRSLPLIYLRNVVHAARSSEVRRLISSALINHSVLAKQSGNK